MRPGSLRTQYWLAVGMLLALQTGCGKGIVRSGGKRTCLKTCAQDTTAFVAPLRIAAASPLVHGTYRGEYTATLTSMGGHPPYSWSVTSGALPDGLKLDPATGTISGAPTTVVASSSSVSVTDSAAATATQPLSLTIDPLTYADFDTSVAPGDGAALKRLLEGNTKSFIYIQSGTYVLQNPVSISRTTTLYLHGLDRFNTVLVAQDPAQPLFSVSAATIINFAGLRIHPTADSPNTKMSRAILTTNTQPIVFEMLDCIVNSSTLDFKGPGSYTLQSDTILSAGASETSVLVDHPGADVFVFGGDWGWVSPATAGSSDYAHVWQKRGRLRVYSLATEGGLGNAAYRIESSGGALGPHFLVNDRSEGNNGALNHTGTVSRLVFVPATDERVDLVIKNSTGGFFTGPLTADWNNCRLVQYNASGTLWLLGNSMGPCGLSLVEGSASPPATIVSAGNLITGSSPFQITGARVVTAHDLFNHFLATGTQTANWTDGDRTNPVVRWTRDDAVTPTLGDYADVPRLPRDTTLPHAVMRPAMPAKMPGMISVKDAAYGAVGDGVADDTAAIQRALDDVCAGGKPKPLYVPAGTYRITRTLALNSELASTTCHHTMGYGGYIAGAGSALTHIVMDAELKEGVFETDGLGFATVQGLTFKTWAWRTGDPTTSNFDIEFRSPVQLTGTTADGSVTISMESAVQLSGTTATGSATVEMANTAGLAVGMPVTDGGVRIPAGESIVSIVPNISITLTTGAGVVSGTTTLHFGSTAGLVVGMSVSDNGVNIPAGERIVAIVPNESVTITTGAGVRAGTRTIKFGSTGTYVASQQDTFYDTVFDGGYGAFATGAQHPSGGNCSSIIAYGSTFKNAHIGFISGHFNAILNGVVDATFTDNDVAIGSWTADPTHLAAGGDFFAYHSVSEGMRASDFQFAGTTLASNFYFYDWTSDAPRFFACGVSPNVWPLMFDESHVTPRAGNAYLFDVACGGGPFFVYSSFSRTGVRVGQGGMARSFAIKLGSIAPDWANSVVNPQSGVVDSLW